MARAFAVGLVEPAALPASVALLERRTPRQVVVIKGNAAASKGKRGQLPGLEGD